MKTLHPKVTGVFWQGVIRSIAGIRENQILPIDMVVVNLYPFKQTICKPGVTLDEAVENIDIGGPTMVRAAAKNHGHVIIVVDPNKYGEILDELREKGDIGKEKRLSLALEAFSHTAEYDSLIADYFMGFVGNGDLAEAFSLLGNESKTYVMVKTPSKAAFYRDTAGCGPLEQNGSGVRIVFQQYRGYGAALSAVKSSKNRRQ